MLKCSGIGTLQTTTQTLTSRSQVQYLIYETDRVIVGLNDVEIRDLRAFAVYVLFRNRRD